MSFFDFFKVLGSYKPKTKEIETDSKKEESKKDDIVPGLSEGKVKNSGNNPVPNKPKPNIPPRPQPPLNINVKENKEYIIKKQNLPDIIEKDKELNMAELYLVVIDTNGRPEAVNMHPGIQNFYIIYANDEDHAKGIVLQTFASRPKIVAQLQYATRATKLSLITKNIGQGSNFWTYVPFGRQRLPGQQALPPKPDELLRPDEYGNPSSKQFTPTAPVGGEQVTEEDLRSVQFTGADGAVINKLRSNTTASKTEAPSETSPTQASTDVSALTRQVAQMQSMMAKMLEANQPKTRKKRTPKEEQPTQDVDNTTT